MKPFTLIALRSRAPVGLCIALLVLTIGAIHHRESGLSGSVTAKIRVAVEGAMRAQRVPGASICVSHRGRRWSGGFGLADVENEVAVTPATVFRVASISKPITATAALQLVEAGALDLDAPVTRYLSELSADYEGVTTRQLLSHQGGVRTYRAGETESARRYESVRGALAMFKDDPLAAAPGARFLYSTYGYNLVGAVVEAVSGEPFRAYLERHVFGPAGMAHARDDDARAIIAHRASGYRRERDGSLVNSTFIDTSNKVPGGGLCATATDLVAFAEGLFEHRLLGSDTVALMTTPRKTARRVPTGYGLGWRVGRYQDRREVSHGGNQPSVSAILYVRPETATIVAILTNLEGAQLRGLARQVADMVEQGD